MRILTFVNTGNGQVETEVQKLWVAMENSYGFALCHGCLVMDVSSRRAMGY